MLRAARARADAESFDLHLVPGRAEVLPGDIRPISRRDGAWSRSGGGSDNCQDATCAETRYPGHHW